MGPLLIPPPAVTDSDSGAAAAVELALALATVVAPAPICVFVGLKDAFVAKVQRRYVVVCK